MTDDLRAPIGTHDVLAPDSALWEGVIGTFADLAHRYDFGLVLSPMFEDVAVFHRGIGEASEVATKEMYVFTDRGDRTYALRPEGTASVVRAFVQHHPVTPWRAWYVTPAFRYERPQAGRYRQHHQLGVEALGSDDAQVDVEVIALAQRFYAAIGLRRVRLLLNSMGHDVCRGEYVGLLRTHLFAHRDELCDDHRATWDRNPLRVLDCKKPACVAVTDQGPMLPDHLCDACRDHLDLVTRGLDRLGIAWERAPRLVRGFDYYTRTTFEFVSDALDAAQNAIGGGGRYDQLAAALGGPDVSGVGFGSGIERLLLARAAEGISRGLIDRDPDCFIVDTTGGEEATVLADELRRAGLAVSRAVDGRSMKSQMKVADRSGARVAVLIGPREIAAGEVTMRDLRASEATQWRVAREGVADAVRTVLEGHE